MIFTSHLRSTGCKARATFDLLHHVLHLVRHLLDLRRRLLDAVGDLVVDGRRRLRRRAAGDRFLDLRHQLIAGLRLERLRQQVRLARRDQPLDDDRMRRDVVGGPMSRVDVGVADAQAVLRDDR